jgi:hypothetical protein
MPAMSVVQSTAIDPCALLLTKNGDMFLSQVAQSRSVRAYSFGQLCLLAHVNFRLHSHAWYVHTALADSSYEGTGRDNSLPRL